MLSHTTLEAGYCIFSPDVKNTVDVCKNMNDLLVNYCVQTFCLQKKKPNLQQYVASHNKH